MMPTGEVRTINKVYLSKKEVVLPSGKLLVGYWRDNIVNGIISRIQQE